MSKPCTYNNMEQAEPADNQRFRLFHVACSFDFFFQLRISMFSVLKFVDSTLTGFKNR